MPKQQQKNDDRNWDAKKPEQNGHGCFSQMNRVATSHVSFGCCGPVPAPPCFEAYSAALILSSRLGPLMWKPVPSAFTPDGNFADGSVGHGSSRRGSTSDGMRRMQWGSDFGQAPLHRAGLPAVPLPRLWQAAQRTNWWVPNRAQYPSDVIALVVFWRLRYKLSLRDLLEMFLHRGIEFTYEAVRDWEAKLTRR